METPASNTILDLVARFEAVSAEANRLRTERSKRIVAFHASGDQSTPEQTAAYRDLTQAYFVAQARADALAAALKALGGIK